jgi:hypothetical protein
MIFSPARLTPAVKLEPARPDPVKRHADHRGGSASGRRRNSGRVERIGFNGSFS